MSAKESSFGKRTLLGIHEEACVLTAVYLFGVWMKSKAETLPVFLYA